MFVFKEVMMKRYIVVESLVWRNARTGATASPYGACPWTRPADEADWSLEKRGYTLRDNHRGTVGIGRQPWKTQEEAQTAADNWNAK